MPCCNLADSLSRRAITPGPALQFGLENQLINGSPWLQRGYVAGKHFSEEFPFFCPNFDPNFDSFL
jgi:hypothetical protein